MQSKITAVLQWAIREGMIPSGALVYDKQILLTSEKTVAYYVDNREECDEYFQYMIDMKNHVEERPQKLSNYLAKRNIDVEYIRHDFINSRDPIIQNELAVIIGTKYSQLEKSWRAGYP